MRILDKEGLKLGLPELGFFTDDQQTFERIIALPDGILLVTGPTGSGKTTTLYSCLHFINRPDRKIITVEDPVEYILAGINQVQVNEQVGLTFASALRAILRQAPNMVMIGEIRDMETASIAINASLTGHLVFSTLHTNDAPGAVDASRGHRRETVFGRLLHALPHGAAPRPQNLQKMRRSRMCRPSRKCARWASRRKMLAGANVHERPRLQQLQQHRQPRTFRHL